MTAATTLTPNLASRLVNTLLSIKPLADLAKHRARQMMIQRAESIGVPWMQQVELFQARDWQADLAAVSNPDLVYPDYYQCSFHAYEAGNLSWEPAFEVEVAAYAVHARIWPDAGSQGDPRLRQSYHQVLRSALPESPQSILDLGCGVGMSTFALQHTFPAAQVTGVDLSPYFLAVAHYRTHNQGAGSDHWQSSLLPEPANSVDNLPTWLNAPAEATGLPSHSCDLVSACLMFHELPHQAAIAILSEARRLLRPGGHLAIMDMNPGSEVYAQMPPYILTLLKSTEPYLDQYFALDFDAAIQAAGFEPPTMICNSPRHRTIMARVKD